MDRFVPERLEPKTREQFEAVLKFLRMLENGNGSDWFHPSDAFAIHDAYTALSYLMEPLKREIVTVTKRPYEELRALARDDTHDDETDTETP